MSKLKETQKPIRKVIDEGTVKKGGVNPKPTTAPPPPPVGQGGKKKD